MQKFQMFVPSLTKKLFLFSLICLFGCSRKNVVAPPNHYDIFLIAGQSNTHQGYGLNPSIDTSAEYIKQLGRRGANNLKIIPATEPLQHWTALQSEIGFALTFAKEYSKKRLEKNRKILLIPCGYGSTGFASNQWNKGDSLYQDAVDRARYALSLNQENRLIAILWHQGESDVGWPLYQQALDSMILNMRRDMTNNSQLPFLLGGMVPYWVAQDNNRIALQSIIANTPSRIGKVAYVSPYFPTVIRKPDSTNVAVHYDATGQRTLGMRYFRVLDSLLNL